MTTTMPTARVLTIVVALVVAGLGPASTAASAAPPASVRGCTDLIGDYPLPGTAAQVITATDVADQPGRPGYCEVRGFVEKAVTFDLRLPDHTYNGRYLQYGCAGLCGTILPGTPAFPAVCAPPADGDFAVAATDDGHVGMPADNPFAAIGDGTWAATDQAARDDLFFRAPHVVSLVSKRIITAYYGTPPQHSYFDGCSTGGREAMLLAQRYPHDFDGIVAGALGSYMGPLFGEYFAYNARVNMDAAGAPILTAEKLPALHAAVLAACDGLDGLVDGQIDFPRACRFDPGTLRCPAGTDQPTCLTEAQVATVRAIYAGPNDGHGTRLYPGSEPYGAELAWDGYLIPHPPFGSIAGIADNYLRYVGFPIGARASSLSAFTFTVRDFTRLTPEGLRGNALSLDLSAFRNAGGKLLVYHGWADQGISPYGTLDYYQRMVETNGGPRATRDWVRLFMVPGLYHCGTGGDTLNTFDPFPQLVDWVEHGNAPNRVVASQVDAQGAVVRTRPVFPYPQRAVYTGNGSIDDDRNFVPAPPAAPPHDTIHWAGEYLYYLRGPVAP
jgi:feruloyl esterase